MPFVDLTGVAAKELEGAFVKSAAGAVRGLAKTRVASLAGDRGAVTVWRDDAGKLRGEHSVFLVTRDSIVAKSMAELRRWLDRTVPLCK